MQYYRPNLLWCAFCAFLAFLLVGEHHACAQSSAFTYQGRLSDGTNPATGTYDINFELFDAVTSGTQQGSTAFLPGTAVSNGLFTVKLDFGPSVFDGSPRWLDIFVRSNGVGGFVEITPREPINSVPYAFRAANYSGPVAASQITGTLASSNIGVGTITGSDIAAGSITGANIASNTITAAQLAPGVASSNLNASSQSGVASGGLVLSATENNAALVNAGYVKIGATTLSDVWLLRTNGPVPSPREYHTAVWTGSEMIVWGGGFGGVDFNVLGDGARYNPVANSWTAVSASGAPTARKLHTAVWTGAEMVVWGGFNGSTLPVNDGGRYNPATDNWTPIPNSLANTPTARFSHTAIWTGTEMIVWGGQNAVTDLNDGGRFNPTSSTWAAVTTNSAPVAREYHTAVWTGTEMIVWGGQTNINSIGGVNDGGRYNPAGNTWTATTTTGAPWGREFHTAVWTGTEMIVWGGTLGGGLGAVVANGGRYNPASDNWVSIIGTEANTPSARQFHTALWTGSEMIVWGGAGGDYPNYNYLNDGARYNPLSNAWTVINTNGAPSARGYHTAVLTGNEMIVWGGSPTNGGPVHFNDGGRYNPAANSWIGMTVSNVPAARYGHKAVWTGSEMIVWGGNGPTVALNDGSRYNLAANNWTALPTNGAPSARSLHTAVWTGTEMIIWGGNNANTPVGDGARYNPVSNSWGGVNFAGAPSARFNHTAVWTGSEMIVWGGQINLSATGPVNDGARYNPVGDGWLSMTTSGAPARRHDHTAVWTGTEMIVWGGVSNATYFSSGGRFNPTLGTWTAVTTSGAPAARSDHTAVWTGSEMIVWGGANNSIFFGDGGRYNPAADSWTAVSSSGAPSARNFQTALWTGSEMLVWGGNTGTFVNDGGRYRPTSDSWTTISSSGSPLARYQHTAVWTGGEMIIFGGLNNSFAPLNDTSSYVPGRVLYLYQRP